MDTSEVISTDKATVVIQINPLEAKDGGVLVDGQQAGGGALKGFFKAQPQALGTVQIMIGVMGVLLGILLTMKGQFYEPSATSGITIWGSFIYISAGSLSVAAQNKLHPCVVKASLGMNVISTITAGISMVLISIDIATHRFYCYERNYSERYYSESYYYCKLLQFGLGNLGILLVFSSLQFIVSIFISAFACKATCNTESTVVNVALNRGY